MWYKKTNGWLAGLLILLLLAACQNFYKARTINTNRGTGSSLDSLKMANRYFILRSGGQAFYMKNLSLSEDRRTLTTTLDTVPLQHRLHVTGGHGNKMRYKKDDPEDRLVLSEVHLYMPAVTTAAGETVTLPLDQVQKIEVIEHDRKRTTNSYVIGALGITAGAFVVAALIVLATKSSCPFVSAHDGKEFSLQGEIYGGAIYPQLARHDFLPLRMAPLADGTLQLKISNELKEKQYTDFANLLVLQHSTSVRVLTDEGGKFYSVASPEAPVSAVLNGNRNVLPALLKEGDNTIAYLDDTTSANASNTISLSFKRTVKKEKAKLVLTLKNSYWLDHLYGELAKGFGTYYATYLKKQAKKPAHQLLQWTREQQIPLTVSVASYGGRKKVSQLTTIGPLANRTVVVPVDVPDLTADRININLSSGFMFWEIDYAALDFSEDDAFRVETLAPVSAIDETGKDVLPTLQKEDGIYLEQPEIGNVATLVYQPSRPQDASMQYTYILHTKGWYQHIRNFTNKPSISFLKQFTKPNAFPQYGKTRYQQFEQESLRFMAANKK